MLLTSPLLKAFITLLDRKSTGWNLGGLMDVYGSLWYIQRSFAVLFLWDYAKDVSLQHRRLQTVQIWRKVTHMTVASILSSSPIFYVLPKAIISGPCNTAFWSKSFFAPLIWVPEQAYVYLLACVCFLVMSTTIWCCQYC